jgi:hypothetical protein
VKTACNFLHLAINSSSEGVYEMSVMANLMEPEVSVGAATEWTPLQYSWRRTSSASGSILGRRRRRRCWVLQRRRNSVSESAALPWELCNVHADGRQRSCVDVVRCIAAGVSLCGGCWEIQQLTTAPLFSAVYALGHQLSSVSCPFC